MKIEFYFIAFTKLLILYTGHVRKIEHKLKIRNHRKNALKLYLSQPSPENVHLMRKMAIVSLSHFVKLFPLPFFIIIIIQYVLHVKEIFCSDFLFKD